LALPSALLAKAEAGTERRFRDLLLERWSNVACGLFVLAWVAGLALGVLMPLVQWLQR
jgi:hypothetical protein